MKHAALVLFCCCLCLAPAALFAQALTAVPYEYLKPFSEADNRDFNQVFHKETIESLQLFGSMKYSDGWLILNYAFRNKAKDPVDLKLTDAAFEYQGRKLMPYEMKPNDPQNAQAGVGMHPLLRSCQIKTNDVCQGEVYIDAPKDLADGSRVVVTVPFQEKSFGMEFIFEKGWMSGEDYFKNMEARSPVPAAVSDQELVLNDVHSRLNATRVDEIHYPQSIGDVIAIIKRAKEKDKPVSISGGRHAMGGQQFAEGSIHINMSKMNDAIALDAQRGVIRVEAGISWPALMEYLEKTQEGKATPWGIIQKQTGADNLSIGGALSANAHGRGVHFKPIVQDILGFTLINANGELLNVTREENAELFKLAIGGYGLFGVITSVDLKLQPRSKLRRTVELLTLDELPDKARERLEEGFLYGDFQYKTDEAAEDFMRVGILSAYEPVGDEAPIPDEQKKLSPESWHKLLHLAHADKSKAFEAYAAHYLSTNGQIYWNDTHQMSYYVEDYIEYLKEKMPELSDGSLMITELYVPREMLKDFIEKVIVDVRERNMNVIYGTMRLIKRDDETFLAWAKEDYACIIFNLRVEHDEAALKKAQGDFQQLIDRALELGGSYFLTYHRFARKDQVLAAYPQFPEFLELKRKYDPQERFQSEWYRHYKAIFEESDK